MSCNILGYLQMMAFVTWQFGWHSIDLRGKVL